MSDNPSARAARKVAEEQRKAELDAISKEVRRWKRAAKFSIIVMWLALTAIPVASYNSNRPWRISEPPADQPVKVVVICYKGKDGVWKSYAEGHPVQPAKEWMWKPVWKP